ncbi:DMT family transporter [Devosia ginsengisoli]|uniref:DMT family transporter n=1 Tax=Devosia ginsengisoli TaxID=400770 RepID=A0A5B8LT09_9HYPH|nr:DMT family transporter [Devosia ginsengisoli]QDZ10632.1 DMT family transporter [Devosia ginsengisoli]
MTKPNPAAALWLATVALIVMAAMSAAIHEAAKIAPVGQLVFWRSFVALIPIVIYMAFRGQLGASLRTKYPHKHLIRGLLGCAVMFFSFISLAYLSVGLATALSYLAPILSIVAAMTFLRERPGAVIFVGVVLGFAGILLMLYPSLVGAEVREGTLIGVAAGVAMAATNALSRVQVKDLTRTDPPASIALSFAVICSLVGLATTLFGWAELDTYAFMLLAGAGVLGGVGHVLMMEAVARAPVSLLAAYEYSGIIWAFLFDLALLGVALDIWSVSGALVVVGAAALVAYGQGRFVATPAAAE